MRRTRTRAAAMGIVWAGLVGLAQACGGGDEPTTRAVGDACYLPTDCIDPLACVFQRCHMQCLSDRDCPTLQICSGALAPKKGVCLLPEETNCALNSDCPFPLVCSRRGKCEAQCQTDRDCLASQTCDRGSCVDKTLVPDGGSPPAGVGTSCTRNSECDAGLVCIVGKCAVECLQDLDCHTDEVCLEKRCYKRAGGDSGPTDGTLDTTDGTIDGTTDSTLGDAPADAPPGYGKPCMYPSDCLYPLLCRSTGVCGWECNLDPDCDSTKYCKDHFCVVRPPDAGDTGVGDGPTDATTDGETGVPCSADGDCDDKNWCNGPERCVSGYCAPALEGPCVSHKLCMKDECDEKTHACTHTPDKGIDVDGDGHVSVACGGDDCVDTDSTIYTGALELCDGKDNDCNGLIDDHAVDLRGTEATITLSTARDVMLARTMGSSFVVASDQKSGTGYDATKILAFTVDTSGKASTEKTVYDAGSGKPGIYLRDLASSGAEAAAVHRMYGGGVGITLFKPDLSTISTTPLWAPSDIDNPLAAVAWGGGQYVVACPIVSGGARVSLAFVKPDGSLAGSTKDLAASTGASWAKIGANGSTFAVAYLDTTTNKLFATIVGPSGTTLAGPTLLESTASFPRAVVPTPTGFAVLHVADIGYSFYNVTVTPVSLAGVKGTSVVLFATDQLNVGMATDGKGLAVAGRDAGIRFGWSPTGVAGTFEMSKPFTPSTTALGDYTSVAALPGPQFGLFHFDRTGGTTLRYVRMGCSP